MTPEDIIDQEYEKYINNDKMVIISKMKQELKNVKITIEEYGIQMEKLEDRVIETVKKMYLLRYLMKG